MGEGWLRERKASPEEGGEGAASRPWGRSKSGVTPLIIR